MPLPFPESVILSWVDEAGFVIDGISGLGTGGALTLVVLFCTTLEYEGLLGNFNFVFEFQDMSPEIVNLCLEFVQGGLVMSSIPCSQGNGLGAFTPVVLLGLGPWGRWG